MNGRCFLLALRAMRFLRRWHRAFSGGEQKTLTVPLYGKAFHHIVSPRCANFSGSPSQRHEPFARLNRDIVLFLSLLYCCYYNHHREHREHREKRHQCLVEEMGVLAGSSNPVPANKEGTTPKKQTPKALRRLLMHTHTPEAERSCFVPQGHKQIDVRILTRMGADSCHSSFT